MSERPWKGPSRSEQLKGTFLEQALQPLLPSEAAFPFAVRVNADVLAANGSLAEVAVNSTALALQAANVSLAAPVAGPASHATFCGHTFYEAPQQAPTQWSKSLTALEFTALLRCQ